MSVLNKVFGKNKSAPTTQEVESITTEKEREIAELGQSEDVGMLLNDIMLEALEKKASDVHFEPRDSDMVIRFRIDGILREVRSLPKKIIDALVFKVKIVSKLRTDEHFAPQDGRIRFMLEDGDYFDTRVSILPISKGEKVVMRLLSRQGKDFTLEELGMGPLELDKTKKAYTKPHGLIIAAGPTGSGKTTTLYSMLKILNSPEINISTIEDPVEYDLPGVNHVQVNKKTDLTFAAGLRALLRQDPDVIMIGEIRDKETARIAINAALTGHLVLSTIHTNDAPSTIPRLIDMGVEPYLVASTVNLVIAQRLARKLIPECAVEYKLSKFEYDDLLLKVRPDIAAAIKVGDKLFRPNDSNDPASCYKGRTGLYEILEVNEELRDLIASRASTDELRKAARKNQDMRTILEAGVDKLKTGDITLTELIRVTALKE
ncbi:MAG: GspE/PulE family protein [Candidatus Dojkabacteria bacterium]